MKLHVLFDVPDLDKALHVAEQIVDFCDVFEIGTLLIYNHGAQAIKAFQQKFPQKDLLAHARITDKSKEAVPVFAAAGSDWMTVMAGTRNEVILSACTVAHNLGKKIMLDLVDASSIGQSALEAKNLGADAILFHQPYDEKSSLTLLDSWEMVRGNTQLPIIVVGRIKRETVDQFLALNPAGIVVGKSIVEADKPAEEAQFFYHLCNQE